MKSFLTDQISKLSMGKHIDPILKKRYSILEAEELLKNNLGAFWTEYLDGKMVWER